jgi:propionate catabolism regulator PrpR
MMNDTNAKIRMVLIATYPEMSKVFLDITAKNDIVAYDEYASFKDALAVAKRMESKVDVILSRGGTAAYIRDNIDTPVVFVPITSFDVLAAVRKLDKGTREIALFHYDKTISGIDDIEDMFDLKIHEYTFESYKDIEKNVEDVMGKGIDTIIGGEVAMRLAHTYGLSGVELSAGVDTISRAIGEAVQIVTESRKAYYQAARIEAAFNSIAEGIVITDENEKVILSNPNAGLLLGREYEQGELFVDSADDSKFTDTVENLQPHYDYIRKSGEIVINASHIPVERDGNFVGVVSMFNDITKIQNTEQSIRKQLHEKGLEAKYRFDDIVTSSEQMRQVVKRSASYASTDFAILIEGESGTGKELFAQSIHNASHRAEGPFVALNCAAIPENLLESELFGYEAGAFTGASKSGKMGMFELAHSGTIFLDEIGEMPLALQARLLRVLQEKEVMRVGGTRYIHVDIRVVSASNKNLVELADRGEFREDLYYRLNVLNVVLPPLRERPADIEPLLRHMLLKGRSRVSDDLIASLLPAMQSHCWPGNIRELQNVAQRLSFIAQHHKDSCVQELIAILGIRDTRSKSDSDGLNIDIGQGLKKAVAEFEQRYVAKVIDICGGDQDMAANMLKIGRTTLWRKKGE